MSQPDREQRVGAASVVLADTLVNDYDIIDLLDQLVAHCVALLAADAAGIMLADARQQLRPVAASSEDAQTMELLQLQSDEGLCPEAYQTASLVRVPDLTQVADRWPRSLNEQLQTTLTSRVIIEQAKGVIAQQLGVSMDAAFDQLRRYARSHSRRLAEVARGVVDRELDLTSTPSPSSEPRDLTG